MPMPAEQGAGSRELLRMDDIHILFVVEFGNRLLVTVRFLPKYRSLGLLIFSKT